MTLPHLRMRDDCWTRKGLWMRYVAFNSPAHKQENASDRVGLDSDGDSGMVLTEKRSAYSGARATC